MKTLIDIKFERNERHKQICKDCGVFWAFSNKQFEESKTPLREGDTYAAIGGGGYLPKSKKEEFIKLCAQMKKDYRISIEENRLQEEEILSFLQDYESFYTKDISDAVEAFKGIYTPDMIFEVYKKYLHYAPYFLF